MNTLRLGLIFLAVLFHSLTALADSGLTKAEVRQYLTLAIELGHLQDRIIEQADQHRDLPMTYRIQGQKLLQTRGSSWPDYNALQQRIIDARTVLEDQQHWSEEIADADATAEELCQFSGEPLVPVDEQKQIIAVLKASGASASDIAEVKASFYPSAQQSTALCEAAKASQNTQVEVQKQLKAETGKDWTAVKAYLPELEALTEWRAGNRATPPAM